MLTMLRLTTAEAEAARQALGFSDISIGLILGALLISMWLVSSDWFRRLK